MNRRKFLKFLSAVPVIAALPVISKQELTSKDLSDVVSELKENYGETEIDPWKKALEPGVLAWKGEMKSAVLNDYWAINL